MIDLMKENKVDLLINTPSGPVARADEIKIRSEAILRGLPIVTTASGAKATLGAIQVIRDQSGPLSLYRILKQSSETYEAIRVDLKQIRSIQLINSSSPLIISISTRM